MLRGAGQSFQRRCSRAAWQLPRQQKFSSSWIQSQARPGSDNANTHYLIASAVAVFSITYYYSKPSIVHNDGASEPSTQPFETTGTSIFTTPSTLTSYVWGSNKFGTLIPGAKSGESIRIPTSCQWLDGVALRDLALHEKYAACADARGDVYRWGEKNDKPERILQGKDIVQLQLTNAKLFALSRSGTIYVLSSDGTPLSSAPSNSGWWGRSSSNILQLEAQKSVRWTEKFVSISAGSDHLLALTSSGRAFAHPISQNANAFGQLAIRNIEQRLPSGELAAVDLKPKPLPDLLGNAGINLIPAPSASLSPAKVEKAFDCPFIYEIPSLMGIHMRQLVAGGRSSFAVTDSGRVLGWGANEFGQIGLGGNIVVTAITVPTEVNLSRNVPRGTISKCRNVAAGGDLSAFTVEHETPSSTQTVELLMCGNGQWGGLGNNKYSTSQSTPVTARNISGLTEYNDKTKSLQTIVPQSVIISPTGHILATLRTWTGGRDLFAWGKNYDSELGNGKKSSVATPTVVETANGERMLLGERKAEVKDVGGQVWKRGQMVSQWTAVGYGNTLMYWKLMGSA